MPQTFGQAKKVLARYASSYDLGDIGAAINTAVDELATSKNWQKLKKVKRFLAYDEFVPIPQDCDSIIRACIDGKPIDVRGADYDFLQSGPGDLDYIPAGYAPTHNIQDMGYFPTMYDISTAAGAKLIAFGTQDLTGEVIKIKGKNDHGDIVAANLTYKVWTDADLGIDSEDAAACATLTASDSLFCEIDRIALPEGIGAYVSLYALADGVFTFLARMHPDEKIPQFRRYRIAGFSGETGAYYRLLAEVKLKALPLVEDWEPMPFDSLLPVQYMLQSLWYMNSGEIKSADEYRQRAIMALAIREDTQQERQGMIILNTHYDDSLGDVSANVWQNI